MEPVDVAPVVLTGTLGLVPRSVREDLRFVSCLSDSWGTDVPQGQSLRSPRRGLGVGAQPSQSRSCLESPGVRRRVGRERTTRGAVRSGTFPFRPCIKSHSGNNSTPDWCPGPLRTLLRRPEKGYPSGKTNSTDLNQEQWTLVLGLTVLKS